MATHSGATMSQAQTGHIIVSNTQYKIPTMYTLLATLFQKLATQV